MGTIKSVLMEKGHNKVREVHNVQDLFREWAIEALKEQGYGVSSKERKEIIVKGSEQIDTEKVQKIIEGALGRVTEGFKALKRAPKENIFQSLQGIQDIEDIKNALEMKVQVQAEPIHKSAPKRKSDSDIIGGEDMSSKAQAKRSNRDGVVLGGAQDLHQGVIGPREIEFILQNTKESSPGKKYAHTQTFPLTEQIKAIGLIFKEYGEKISKKIIGVICSLFEKEVITTIEKRDYRVTIEQEKGEAIINGNKSIEISEINKNIADSLTEVTMKSMKKIKALESRYKGKQLKHEVLKSLNADLPGKDINSNYKKEPIFQTPKEVQESHFEIRGTDPNSNPISRRPLPPVPTKNHTGKVMQGGNRGDYNAGEPTHGTVEEAQESHSKIRDIKPNSVSKEPLAPQVPPKSRMKGVTTTGGQGQGIKIGQ
ncbi:hypothetical protein [Wolbachia endosymbiont of Cantharis cryptica]|uniref:hypothetical protein n=1 Tax=Wolbachia endosymbiont of Cantharis cryptica TaxID=3066132 RepID=UPI00376F01DB